jgi:hypothetical protein
MIEVNLKNIIYDSAAAKTEVEHVEKEQPGINRKNKIWNICMFILIFIVSLGAAISLTLLLLAPDGPMTLSWKWLPTYAIIAVGLCIGVSIWEEVYRDVPPRYEWLSANAKYYKITNGYNVLACHILHQPHPYRDEGTYTVHVTLEDTNHVVTHRCLTCPVICSETRTDIHEITLDLPKARVCIPYSKQ